MLTSLAGFIRAEARFCYDDTSAEKDKDTGESKHDAPSPSPAAAAPASPATTKVRDARIESERAEVASAMATPNRSEVGGVGHALAGGLTGAPKPPQTSVGEAKRSAHANIPLVPKRSDVYEAKENDTPRMIAKMLGLSLPRS